MRYRNVHIAASSYVLPEEVVTSEAIEDRLAPLYDRLGLHTGRLELMTGIRERRFWPPGTRPSAVAAAAGRLALERGGIDPARVGTLIHASVCRDFLEPATASVVHSSLGLPATCAAFDLSNACLGVANSMALLAGAIERGEIEAGLAVAGEDGRPLVEATLTDLAARSAEVTRGELKRAFASLTIGSGAAAVLLARADLCPDGPALLGAVSRAATEHHVLCHGDTSHLGGPLMETDSEALLHAGMDLARETFDAFSGELEWSVADLDRVVTHQVGVAHRRRLMETLGVDPAIDYPTVERLGNVGSVSLPLSFSMARDEGFIASGQRVALFGIGSGLHCLMLAVRTA